MAGSEGFSCAEKSSTVAEGAGMTVATQTRPMCGAGLCCGTGKLAGAAATTALDTC